MKDLGLRSVAAFRFLTILVMFIAASSMGLHAAAGSSYPASAVQISASPGSIGFGNVLVGSAVTQPATITNQGSTSVTITQITTPQGFTVSGLSRSNFLAAGQTLAFSIVFAPTATGTTSGSVSITASNKTNKGFAKSSTASISVTGTGVTQGQLSPNPTSVNFGSVTTSSTTSQTVKVTNSGGSTVTISSVAISGTGFSVGSVAVPLSLSPAQSASFTVSFYPTSTGTFNGSLTIANNGLNPSLSVGLTGTAVAPASLSVSPTSMNFGNVPVGSPQTQNASLANTGGSSASISQVTTTGSGFSVSGLNVPLTVPAGQTVWFSVSYAPQVAGSSSGSVTLASTVPVPPIALSGSGVLGGQLAASPTSLNFGNVTIGTSNTQSGSLTATGASVTVSSASSTDAEYSLSGITLPVTLAAGQTVPFKVSFTPSAPGMVSANLAFTSNASTSPTVGLSGTGAAPHTVALSWAADSSPVTGYNVYRGTTSGGPYTQVYSLTANTAYTDTAVQSGSTYYYVITAVSTTGTESGYSNQAQAAIPSP